MYSKPSGIIFTAEAWNHSLPYLSILWSIFWTLVYVHIGDRVLLKVVPQLVRDNLAKKKSGNLDFRRLCRVNGVAFIHAVATTPLNLLTVYRLNDDHYLAESKLFDTLALVMTGYFIWDLLISCRDYKKTGISFIVHALISFTALWLHVTSKEIRTSWLAAALMATEISTPFLHLRWFLLQGNCTSGKFFQVVNGLFIASFVGYRLFLVEIYALWPYTRFVWRGTIDLPRRHYFQCALGWLWVCLNYYWAIRLARSQWKAFVQRGTIKKK